MSHLEICGPLFYHFCLIRLVIRKEKGMMEKRLSPRLHTIRQILARNSTQQHDKKNANIAEEKAVISNLNPKSNKTFYSSTRYTILYSMNAFRFSILWFFLSFFLFFFFFFCIYRTINQASFSQWNDVTFLILSLNTGKKSPAILVIGI